MQVTPSHKPQASKPSIAAALLASGKRRAGSGDVLWMVLRESLVLVAVGTLPGLVAAWGLTRFISTTLPVGSYFSYPNSLQPWSDTLRRGTRCRAEACRK